MGQTTVEQVIKLIPCKKTEKISLFPIFSNQKSIEIALL
jgi:hypothetical protein